MHPYTCKCMESTTVYRLSNTRDSRIYYIQSWFDLLAVPPWNIGEMVLSAVNMSTAGDTIAIQISTEGSVSRTSYRICWYTAVTSIKTKLEPMIVCVCTYCSVLEACLRRCQ